MKKRLSALLLTLVLCLALSVPALAADLPRFVDEAGLLTSEEAASLTGELDGISERLGFDVVIVTLNTLNGADPEGAAEYIYDEYHYGYGADRDGVLLLVNMGERDWAITSTGRGQWAINEDARAYLADSFLGDLSSGNYYAAFTDFARGADALVTQSEASGGYYKAPFPAAKALVVSLVIGLLLALLVVSSMKRKLKSVALHREAADYARRGSLVLTESKERFLYHNVVRTPKPQKMPASHGGGGGVSHSSSHGKF